MMLLCFNYNLSVSIYLYIQYAQVGAVDACWLLFLSFLCVFVPSSSTASTFSVPVVSCRRWCTAARALHYIMHANIGAGRLYLPDEIESWRARASITYHLYYSICMDALGSMLLTMMMSMMTMGARAFA